MAGAYSKLLFLTISRNYSSTKCVLPILRISSQFSTSSVNYFDHDEVSKERMSRAMKAYLERAKAHEEFMEEQLKEYNIGKAHLANMMGKKVSEMTQADVDEAINYLLPCGLFVPKSRPIMKPPEEVFAQQKDVEFDYTGRPFHFLFYTTRPNFCQLLHDAATNLQKITDYERSMLEAGSTTPPNSISFVGTEWLSQEALEKKILEKLYKMDYNKFIEVFERIASHPYSYLVEEFVRTYRTQLPVTEAAKMIVPSYSEDGAVCVKIDSASRKSAKAKVEVKFPGTGKITINNVGIDYFSNIECREQIFKTFSNESQIKVKIVDKVVINVVDKVVYAFLKVKKKK